MFKIKCIPRPRGVFHDVIFKAIYSLNQDIYILKHIEERLYKVYSIDNKNINLNDSRGTWKERNIIEKFEKGDWIKLEN